MLDGEEILGTVTAAPYYYWCDTFSENNGWALSGTDGGTAEINGGRLHIDSPSALSTAVASRDRPILDYTTPYRVNFEINFEDVDTHWIQPLYNGHVWMVATRGPEPFDDGPVVLKNFIESSEYYVIGEVEVEEKVLVDCYINPEFNRIEFYLDGNYEGSSSLASATATSRIKVKESNDDANFGELNMEWIRFSQGTNPINPDTDGDRILDGDIVIHRYVSPSGTGSGEIKEDPAGYVSVSFWNNVQTSLSDGHVKVWFLEDDHNDYDDVLYLLNKGHDDYLLELLGYYDDCAEFKDKDTMIKIEGSKNIRIRDLKFMGSGITDRAIKIEGETPNYNIEIDSCTFEDMNLAEYGAIGIDDESNYITVRNSWFKKIGHLGGAHMIYVAYGSEHIYVVNNYFEDCSGSYIDFRDEANFGYVKNNYFNHPEGAHKHVANSFIRIRARNTDQSNDDEHFGNNYAFLGNTFIYCLNPPGEGTKLDTTLRYKHFNWEPNDWEPPEDEYHYRMTGDDWSKLGGTDTQKKIDLFSDETDIDIETILFYDNTHQTSTFKVIYQSNPLNGPGENYVKGDEIITDVFE